MRNIIFTIFVLWYQSTNLNINLTNNNLYTCTSNTQWPQLGNTIVQVIHQPMLGNNINTSVTLTQLMIEDIIKQ